MTSAYIALGSNLSGPLGQLQRATDALHELPDTRLERISRVYHSAAVGPGEQPDYLNAVVCVETSLAALDLLDALQAIETAQGRVRTERWGARTLDLDLLLYGDATIDCSRLRVPHPRMCERAFVLLPLADIAAANLQLPNGEELAKLVAACPPGDVCRTELMLSPPGPADRHGQHL